MKNNIKPSLYGIKNSNRDFSNSEFWGKNQFNSSFPIALACFMHNKALKANYIRSKDGKQTYQDSLGFDQLFKFNPSSENIFYSFETTYYPFQQLVIGNLEKNDVVIQDDKGNYYSTFEIKLTAVPDNTTANLDESLHSCEIVVRPSTIIYLACSIAFHFKNNKEKLKSYFSSKFSTINDWNDPVEILSNFDLMQKILVNLIQTNPEMESPLMLQPIWKTIKKIPKLHNNALDIFIWSNFALFCLFSTPKIGNNITITRQDRTVVWLFKMLYDFSTTGKIDFKYVIDNITLNVKNDKAFASSGLVTYKFLKSNDLLKPRVTKFDIKNIILGGGEKLLSPERRFDAVISYSPELFNNNYEEKGN